jgi:hypothetical protein
MIGDQKAVVKTKSEHETSGRESVYAKADLQHEMAAQAVNDELDLVVMPTSVMRDFGDMKGPRGSKVSTALVMEFRKGDIVGQRWGEMKPEQLNKMALFDAVIGNLDRKGGNAMVDPSGNLMAIDHGLAFPFKNPDVGNGRAIETRISRGLRNLTAGEEQKLKVFVADRPRIDRSLSKYLKPEESRAMWERVNHMLTTKDIYPAGGKPGRLGSEYPSYSGPAHKPRPPERAPEFPSPRGILRSKAARKLLFLDLDDNVLGTLSEDGKATGLGEEVHTLNVIDPETNDVLTPSDPRYLDAVRFMYPGGYAVRAVYADEAQTEQKTAENSVLTKVRRGAQLVKGTVIDESDSTVEKARVPKHLATHRPQDRDLVGYATGVIRSRWLQEAGRLIEPREWLDELSTRDVDSIIRQVTDKWDGVYEACLPMLLDIVNESVQRGMLSMPETVKSVEDLKALGAEWLNSFAKTMIRRWVGDRIRRAINGSTSLESQSLDVVKAVEQVPDAFSIVMQPMIRRLLAFGSLMQEIERHEPHVRVRKARETQRYVIVTTGDDRVCKVCEYISEIGPFWLKDALDLFDNYIEAMEEEDAFAEELLAVAWLAEDEVQGLTRTELKNLGQIVPPFHPECRCGIAFVE